MTKWLRIIIATAVLCLSGMAAIAKPLPPFVLELEPVDPQPLPASVRFVARVETFQDLKNVDFSFILPATISTSSQTEWRLQLQAGQPQQFELVLELDRWPQQPIGAQVRLFNGDERFILTDYFVLPDAARNKAGRGHGDVLRQRDGRMVRERAL